MRRQATVPPFDEDLETAGGPETVQALRGQIASADALLIATPEYNHSIPGDSTGSLVLPAPAQFVANAKRLFDESGKLVDASLRERLSALLTGLGAWIDRVGG